MCPHIPCCPDAGDPDRDAARVTVDRHDQGWALLCNGVVHFDDTGELLPDGCVVEPARGPSHRSAHVRVLRQLRTVVPQPA